MAENTEIDQKEASQDELKLKDLRNDRLGLDSIMDDMIGLNIQGFKSLFAVCFKPASYFQAAKLADWAGKYRASFRLLFAILALTAATRFLWASDTSIMVLEIAKLFDGMVAEEVDRAKAHGQILDTSNFNSIEASSLIFKKLMIALPFATTITFAIFAWAYRAWGEKLTYVVRLRYTYAVLVPSTTVSMLFNFILIWTPQKAFDLLSNISMALLFIVIIFTAYFGPFRNQEAGGRIGRSLCIAICMIGFYFTIAIILTFPLMFSIFESMPSHDHSLPLISKTE